MAMLGLMGMAFLSRDQQKCKEISTRIQSSPNRFLFFCLLGLAPSFLSDLFLFDQVPVAGWSMTGPFDRSQIQAVQVVVWLPFTAPSSASSLGSVGWEMKTRNSPQGPALSVPFPRFSIACSISACSSRLFTSRRGIVFHLP